MPTLTKSRFISGTQCAKKLYFDVFQKNLKPETSAQQQALFDTGHHIGILAQSKYPGGKNAIFEFNGNWDMAIARTRQWLLNGTQTIYEASFSIHGCFAAVDILHHQNGQRWAIEVKSSTSVKDYHLTDAAFQYYVMEQAGFAPDEVFIMHINNSYVKQGELDINKLFHCERVTQKVRDMQMQITIKHVALQQLLNRATEPNIDIGSHCLSPFECPYMHHCWAHITNQSVLHLNNPRGKQWQLYENGIQHLADIPEHYPLNHQQYLQVEGVRNNTIHIDRQQLQHFLNPIQKPLCFFDFETINPALPVLNGTKPFEQVPFQYSLHICDAQLNIQQHCEFLAQAYDFTNATSTDPRLQLIEQLKRDMPQHGSIIAYNAAFEISILKGLAIAFPDEEPFLNGLITRFVDLYLPFKSGWYYKPEMGASLSIKSVLPAIAPEFSYADLKIANGGLASSIFYDMIADCFSGNIQETRSDLLEYCKRDTEGMIIIYRHLKQISTL